MIQPVKKFQVLSLSVKGFKGFLEETSFTFGDMNTITGHNGQGKSSIADAIAFAITGVGFYGGTRLDHLYHTNTRDISVTLAFADESGAAHRLSRRRVDDNMDIFLDERRITQRDLTLMFGERDLFLSIFNPRYFIDVLGVKGRDLLERYLPDIPKTEIMDRMNELDRALLETQDFLSAEAFAKKLREEIAQLKRDAIYTQGQYDLQVSQAGENAAQLEEKQTRYDSLTAEAASLETRRTTGFDGTSLTEKLPDLYARHEELLREQPAGPELTAELDAKIQAAAQSLEQALAELRSRRDSMVADEQQKRIQRQQEIDRLHAEIQNTELDLEYGRLSPEEGERLRQVKEELVRLSAEIKVLASQAAEPPANQTLKLEQLQAQQKDLETLLSALAAYIAKRVEIRFSQLHMNRVSISLYEAVKSTGEVRDVFKFTYEGRPYVCLSGSERIRAGLEVAELVKGLVGVDFPVFIDDAERVPIIDNVRPTGQIFIAKVAKGVKLTVQTTNAAPPAQAA